MNYLPPNNGSIWRVGPPIYMPQTTFLGTLAQVPNNQGRLFIAVQPCAGSTHTNTAACSAPADQLLRNDRTSTGIHDMFICFHVGRKGEELLARSKISFCFCDTAANLAVRGVAIASSGPQQRGLGHTLSVEPYKILVCEIFFRGGTGE